MNDLNLHELIGREGGCIKSVQSGELSIPDASLSSTVTIDHIDPTKSIILASFANYNSGRTVDNVLIASEIIDSTKIKFSRTTGGGIEYVAWYVVEFANVKSVQSGSVARSSAVQNITIAPVDLTKSFSIVSHLAASEGASTDVSQALIRHRLTNENTLTIYNYSSGTYFWQVVELK